jgi:AcrR family transcriptional regulator
MGATKRGWHAGEALREIVGEGRVTAEEAATELGVASGSLYRYFRTPEMPLRVAKRIAPKLGLRVEWLMTGRGEKYEAHPLLEANVEQRIERIMRVYLRSVERETRTMLTKVVKLTSNLDVLDGDAD